jgi:hypothetical protein
MRKMKLWTGPVCGVLIGAFPLFAQTGSETLAETTDWLKKNLGGAACVVFQMGASRKDLKPVTENTEVRFSGCDMILETATTIGPSSELRTFDVPLGKFNPAGVSLIEGFKIPSGWVTAGEIPSTTIRLTPPPGDSGGAGGIDAKLEQFGAGAPKSSRYRAAEINILVRHKDTAGKLANALSRAITLCRGK